MINNERNYIYFLLIFFIKYINIYNNNIDCSQFKNCYTCNTNFFCTWCPNTKICMYTYTKSNCDISYITNLINKYNYEFLTQQYKCISNFSNEILIYKDLKSFSYKISSNYSNEKLYLYKIFVIRYSNFKRLKINFNIFNSDLIQEIAYLDSIDEKENIISKYNPKIIQLKTIELIIKITYLTSLNEDSEEEDILEIFLNTKGEKLNIYEIILIIVFSIFGICSILGFILMYVNKKNRHKNEIYLRQKKHLVFTNEKDSIKNYQNNIDTGKKDRNLNNLNIINSNKFNDNEIKLKFKAFPSFIIDKTYNNFTYYVCDYCENLFKMGNKVIILNCNHFYHYKCLYNQVFNKKNYICCICNRCIFN